jgi:hypothetical protein
MRRSKSYRNLVQRRVRQRLGLNDAQTATNVDEDKYIKEARELVKSSNTTSIAILVGTIVFWFTNVFPLDLSGNTGGAAISRLKHLSDIRQTARDACDGARSRLQSLGQTQKDERCSNEIRILSSECEGDAGATRLVGKECALRNRSGAGRKSGAETNLASWVARITPRLGDETLTVDPRCGVALKEWRSGYLEVCRKRLEDITKYISEITKDSGIDLLGMKLKNIYLKWHPIVLAVIILFYTMWLGNKRRQLYALLNSHFSLLYDQKRSVTKEGNSPSPIFLVLAWWLYPLPNRKYAGGLELQDLIAAGPERSRARVAATMFALLLGAMAYSSLWLQWALSAGPASNVSGSCEQLIDGSECLSITGFWIKDIAVLSVILALAWWSYRWTEPLLWRRPQGSDARSHRRHLLKLLGLVGSSAAVAAISGPFIVDYRRAIQQIETEGRTWIGLKPRVPRVRKVKQVAAHRGPPGWYFNGVPNGMIGHFVRPGRTTVRKEKYFVFSRLRTYLRAANTIRGAGRINTEHLVPLDYAALLQLKPESQAGHLAFGAYSEGVENLALGFWRKSDHHAALELLSFALDYARPRSSQAHPRWNWRLVDLYAGLLVRAGRESELEGLAGRFRGEVADVEKARANQRLMRWRDPSGRWHQKWRRETSRRWNGLDV